MRKVSDNGTLKVAKELKKYYADGITDEEFQRGKAAVRAGVLLAGEDSAYRMDRIGSSEVWDGYAKSPEEMMADLSEVTIERVEEIARMLGGLEITATTRKHARELLAS